MKRLFLIAILLCAGTAEAKTKATVVVNGVEYIVTVENEEAFASRTGLRPWTDRVGKWRDGVAAIEQASGCKAEHVTVMRAHYGGIPVAVHALLDCSKTNAQNLADE